MAGALAFVIMSMIVLIVIVAFILTYTEKWFSGLDPKTNYTFNTISYNKYPIIPTNSNKVYKTPNTLLKNEKHQPPRAEFFGRLGGEENTEEGKYEEQYLNKWELQWWKEQKQREEALKAGILNEIQ